MGFFGVLLEALGMFLGFDFYHYLIIPNTWKLEYNLRWDLTAPLPRISDGLEHFMFSLSIIIELVQNIFRHQLTEGLLVWNPSPREILVWFILKMLAF